MKFESAKTVSSSRLGVRVQEPEQKKKTGLIRARSTGFLFSLYSIFLN
ncbi:hypothetical protein LEP1GSC052_1719 [Leptospira kmetyi serovar Malaysia str. Bejo-Iso9]|nr:hypothetical protein LEP1GSC052_1719 [Leptospira kmetyi serovar Malaysia str. Bejo-Iso9]